ncbi:MULTISPECIES: DUF305 domain-containing protein [Microbacterium]|uniref:DUF305 domain-containing protein n=1 Tax=Microbacterium wangchenii TaxID=2541726 RepID=A0ABX5SU39_9MICO|nr:MULTISPECIES: DUF305 domain-containing protein [Microbacterium]MCK6067366.1 DUF305 domain-containing protein [Microbacterium sp. EYE_512]QBR89693.1 DUF305 domain-containing protein [Microbacterium wangchenii]TFV81042.1 DUF305 domain-containing protein [Microbacterium sp. dk485]TXK16709.1 DUF305 domain-containing protein [Microbacterium wangchenii]
MTDRAPTAPRGRAAPWVMVLLVAVAVAAVAFAIGRFTAFGATAATEHPSTTSAEAGFARDMQVHHGQAVEMAMEIHRKTEDPQLRVLAYDMATAQAGQRGEMYGWLVSWGLPQAGGPLMAWMADSSAHDHAGAADAADPESQMGMATPEQLAQLREATGTEADCLFLELMIRHHQGAIPMAEAVVELGSDARVDTVAEGMIAAQTGEIDAMEAIASRLGCAG